MSYIEQVLQSVFGHQEFRPHQRDVIADVLRGNDVLCVMPTGAGKSLCFQLPAVANGGLTIIVSPLISLMADQVSHLKRLRIPSLLLNSSLSTEEQSQVLRQLAAGFSGLLYVAPERFASGSFQRLIPRIKTRMFVVDEAHCVSFWGHDFRPEYMRLMEVRRQLGDPVTIAVTATATLQVQKDIVRMLGLRTPRVHVTGFDRPNLTYACKGFERDREKEAALLRFLSTHEGSGIVYCSTRKNVEELTTLLSRQFRDRTVTAYHAGMTQDERKRSQEKFMAAERSLVVATNAFGMGINKPDIRYVAHYNLPGSLEAYYQEAGRAGRDGKPSHCLLYHSGMDLRTQRFFIQKIGDENPKLTAEDIARLQKHAGSKLNLMFEYATKLRCRRRQILDYFGENSAVADCACDICTRPAPAAYKPIAMEKVREPRNEQRERVAKSKHVRPQQSAELGTDARQLFERLRTWRLEFARKNGWPAYCILQDSALLEIAKVRPRSLKELGAIDGMGPKRLERYGESLLAELSKES